MPLTPEQVSELAHALHKAEHTLEPIAPLTEQYPDIDISDAYAIQLEGIRERTQAHGGEIVGWKVGLTSKAMQQMLGVDQPDFGHLLDNMRMDEGTDIDCAEMIWPRVEPEIAFQLKADLRGPGVTADDVIAATEYLIPALEKQLDVLARGLVFYAAAMGWEIKHPDQNGPGVASSVADELGVR